MYDYLEFRWQVLLVNVDLSSNKICLDNRSIACAEVRSEIPIARTSLDKINSSPPSILKGEFLSNQTGTSSF